MAFTISKPEKLDVELRVDAHGRILCVRCGLRQHGQTEALEGPGDAITHLEAHAKVGHRVPKIPAFGDETIDAMLAEVQNDVGYLRELQDAGREVADARAKLQTLVAENVALQARVAALTPVAPTPAPPETPAPSAPPTT